MDYRQLREEEAAIKAENPINGLNGGQRRREREEEEAEREQTLPCAAPNYSLCSICFGVKNIFQSL